MLNEEICLYLVFLLISEPDKLTIYFSVVMNKWLLHQQMQLKIWLGTKKAW